MKLTDMKIGAQLRLGTVAILLLVALLGATAWFQAESLWQDTRDLYEHPLQVRRALGDLTSDILAIHRDMKDLILAEDEQQRQSVNLAISVREADIARQIEALHAAYLGPRSDIGEVQDSLAHWKSIREETIRIFRAGKIAEALRRTRPGGAGADQAARLLKEVEHISDFARKKADQLYQAAVNKKEALMKQLGMVFGAIVLLTLGVAYLLLKGIREPLRELTSAADRFGRGEMAARSGYASANEFGRLSVAFNSLAETVETEWRGRESAAGIAGVMLREEELHLFSRDLLKELLSDTGSQIAAIYLLNEAKTTFDHFESIGLSSSGRASFSAIGLEGEFGSALASGKIQHLTEIPEDSRFAFATAGGDFHPREIITIPIQGDGGVVAVISLAGIRSYPTHAVRLVNDIWDVMTARLNGVLAAGKIRDFAERLDRQNQRLQAQQEELQQQNEELENQQKAVEETNRVLRDKNMEIEAQAEEMAAQTEELMKQSKELQRQNVELERQRLAVEEASSLKSQFLSNMSHELRTPLNSVMALSRVLMMQAKTKLGAEEINYLEIIERNGKNLLTLINDILDLSKIEAGRMDVNPRPFSLGRTLENIVESIAPLAEGKGISISKVIPDDLPLLESDEIRVSQILQNLISNAVKFTEKGSVTVSAGVDDGRITIGIRDTGIGIADKDLPYIFDEFRQVDGTSARRHEGTGLGLAIARKASRMLGGEIMVESAPGKGSSFTLTLPVAWQAIAVVREPIVVRQPPQAKAERKTVLIVDDEPAIAETISSYLIQSGYNTLTATSGAEALRLAAGERPFAITLDIIMPEMDGWEVLQNLKKNQATKDIPVIVVSVSEDRTTGFALGAIGYVTKPVSKNILISEIEKIARPGARSVMIVDDSDLDRDHIRTIVEGEGLTPVVARDGTVCLELINREIPDVLVLDLMMPEMDGFSVLERVRGNPATRDMPIIVVTAKDLTDEERKKLSGNVFSVLAKGAATSTALLEEIKRILQILDDPRGADGAVNRGGTPRVLLVEDNEAAIIQVKAVLEAAGYGVDVAKGGREAFDHVSRTIPDGIILDLMMPGIDGFEVLERIRGTKATVGIPVLILTAKDLTPEDFKRLSANNVQQLVQKGDVDRNNLLLKVRTMLEKPKPRAALHDTGPSILVVEDNQDNMITIKAVLRDRYNILEATDGEEGLRMAVENRPDLILLDMALPKMDGLTVVRHIKENGELRKVPVIAMTARVMKGDREKILEAGCDDYISKPIDPEGFLEKVGGWLKGLR